MPTALVTGASSGIGRAAALRLARMGYSVGLVGRTAETLEKVATEIRHAGGPNARAIVADVSKLEQVNAAVQAVHQHFGRLDVLVNNAGAAPVVTLAECTPEQWHAILDANVSSTFYATRAVWPLMEQQYRAGQPGGGKEPGGREGNAGGEGGRGGVIVNISSMASKDPFPGLGVYGCAKAALNLLTLVTAREGAKVGIRAVGIAPAAVETPMFRGVMGGRPVDAETILRPEEVADAVGEVVGGALRNCSGETIYLHRGAA